LQQYSLVDISVKREAIPTDGMFASCHASTVAKVGDRAVVAYFAGPYEGHRLTSIWLSKRISGDWHQPVEIFTGKEVLGIKRPCWNPVFFQLEEKLYLFFKVGKSPEHWRGYYSVSRDAGDSWTPPQPHHAGIFGPTKNSPIQLGDMIVSGSSDERYGCSIHFELSLNGRDWRRTFPKNSQQLEGCIQPAIISLGGSRLVAFARSSTGVIVRTESSDCGETWSDLHKTKMPNPDSAVSAISLNSGCHFLVYNKSGGSRTPLVLATSSDGEEWRDLLILEEPEGEYSYPSLCQIPGGVSISYTVNRTSIGYAEIRADHWISQDPD